MHRFRLAAAALACAALSSACYRVTITTAAVPTTMMVDKPWVNSFIYGLVPPSAPINVQQPCNGNVSQVVTQRSFLNGLVASLTWGIYTPMRVTVTCGSAGRTGSIAPMGLPQELLGAPVAAASVAGQ